MLRNRFYVGEVKYKDEILPGEQPAIVDRALFDAYQGRGDANKALGRIAYQPNRRGRPFHFRCGPL